MEFFLRERMMQIKIMGTLRKVKVKRSCILSEEIILEDKLVSGKKAHFSDMIRSIYVHGNITFHFKYFCNFKNMIKCYTPMSVLWEGKHVNSLILFLLWKTQLKFFVFVCKIIKSDKMHFWIQSYFIKPRILWDPKCGNLGKNNHMIVVCV